MRLIYIIGPYRAETSKQVCANIIAAEHIAQEVIELGIDLAPVTPHLLYCDLDEIRSDEYYLEATKEVLRKCDAALSVLDISTSEGSKAEVEECKRLGIPLFHSVDSLIRWHTANANKTQRIANANKRS